MKNHRTKFIVSCLIALVVFGWVLPSQAATITELQVQINNLISQVTALQSQLLLMKGTASTTPVSCAGITFSRPLLQGSFGNDVKCLQALLNQNTDTRIAASGSGSLGHETYYYGYLTKLAVIKFQNKYASEVLVPSRLTYGTGIVGPTTRAKLNAITSVFVAIPTTQPVTPPTTGGGSTVTPPPATGGDDGGSTVTPTPVTDTTPPSQVTNLSTSNLAQTSVALNWTAPGDDGTSGTATSYDIRYSTASITSFNWTSTTQASGEPTPLTSGTAQSFTVTGLTANTTYYFAIKATDDASNISALSNVSSGKTLAVVVIDITPPVRSSGLPIGTLAAGTTQATISLSTNESATCKYGTTSGTAYASMTGTFTTTGGTTHSKTVTGLSNGKSYTYYIKCRDTASNANTDDFTTSFSVSSPSCVDCGLGTPIINPTSPLTSQSFTLTCPANAAGYDCIDAYANGSSNKCTFNSYSGNNAIYNCTGLVTGSYTSRCVSKTGTSRNCCASERTVSYTVQPAPDITVPSQITNLSTSSTTKNSITLNWTSPGDDGTSGTATSYDIRYSTAAITAGNWTSATQASREQTPLTSGTAQSFTVTGLTASTTYYFAIKATDDASNISALSNVSSGKTLAAATVDCFGAELCNNTGNPIGGGAGYNRIILETDPSVKYVISTKDQFLSALSQVKSGEVIFVKGDANIDMTGIYGTIIPGGITIASDRGLNGSQGGSIFQNRLSTDPKPPNWNTNYGSMLIAVGDGVRVTGLRLEGPDKTTANMERIGPKSGIFFRNVKGVEVDNCEIFGWSVTGIYVNNVDASEQAEGLAATEIGSTMANVHHNYIHHCQSDGLGYGVQVGYGSVLVKANLFEYTRHSIAAGGQPGEGYEASYNIQNDHTTSQVFDVHGYPSDGASHAAGSLFRFHHNTILSPSHAIGNSIVIRGTPLINASITFNRLNNCYVECQHGSYNGTTPNPVYQPIGGSNVTMTNNYVDDTYYESGPISQGSMGG